MKRFAFLLLSLGFTAQFALAQPGAFSLVSPTNSAWASATPSFDWGNSTGATYYQLWIDGALKRDSIAASNYQLSQAEALTEALHTWNVRARNSTGQTTQSTETWSIRIDATPPTVFDLTSPTDQEWTGSVRPTLQWAPSSDAGSGLQKYQLVIDGIVAVDSVPTSSTSRTSPSDLATGTHSWHIRAIDVAGNTRVSNQTWTIRVDDLGPVGSANPAYIGSAEGHSILIPHNQSQVMNGTITIEAWVKQTGGGGDQFIVAKSSCCSPTGFEMKMVGNSSSRRIQCGFGRISGVSPVMQTNSTLAMNTWYHVAVTLGNGGFSIYLNGILDNYQNATIGSFGQVTSDMRIGASTYITNPTSSFIGEIDEVRLWNVVRTQSDIARNMRKALRGNELGLVGYWRMNDGGNSFVSDLSPYQNHGLLTNGASLSNSSLRGPSFSLDALPLIQPANSLFFVSPVTFEWGRVTDAGIGFGKYQLFVDGTLRTDNIQDTLVVVGPFSYGRHSWYIVAMDLLGNAQPSPVRIFSLDSAPPNAFNLLSPLDSEVVAIPTPTFTWQATVDSSGGSGLREYQLCVDGTVNIDSIPPTSTSSSPSTLLSKSPHTWFVRALDNVGNLRESNQTRTVFVDINPPTAFDLVVPTNGDTARESRPRFTWRRSTDIGSGIARYEVSISGQAAFSVSGLDSSGQAPSVLPNGSYTWFVKAFDRGGQSRVSNQTWTVVVNVLPPAIPTLSSPPNGSTNQPITLTVSWTSATGADVYHLQVATDSNFTTIVRNDSTITSSSSQIGPLANAVTYYWRVRAKNLAGISSFSSKWNFTTVAPLEAPTLVSPSNGAMNQPTSPILSWNAVSGATSYRLQVVPSSSSPMLDDSTLTGTSRQMSSLTNNTTYYWHVKAKDAGGTSEWSSLWSFTTMGPTIVEQLGSDIPRMYALHQNYPNPFNPTTTIQFSVPKQSSVILTIFNSLGMEIDMLVNQDLPPGDYQIHWTPRGIASGAYFYRLQAGSFVDTKKLTLLR